MFSSTIHKCLCVFVVICTSLFCRADRIVLKQGQTLTGDILAEKETQLFVDIGVTVLTIPKEKILQYEYSKTIEPAVPDSIGFEGIDIPDTDKLYKTADLKKTTIEKCVETVAESVVKVSTPAGIGSGFRRISSTSYFRPGTRSLIPCGIKVMSPLFSVEYGGMYLLRVPIFHRCRGYFHGAQSGSPTTTFCQLRYRIEQ